MTYETTITLGGITGCLLSLFPFLRIPGLGWLTPFLGIAVGVFVGCQAVALAEILNVFPIMFRRMKLKKRSLPGPDSHGAGKGGRIAVLFFLRISGGLTEDLEGR